MFKMAIIVERVNLYTTGIIFPRDQNLNIIPFFDMSNTPANGYVNTRTPTTKNTTILYDYQSSLRIISAIKAQIDRLELIEIHNGTVFLKQTNQNLNSSTLSMDIKASRKDNQETEKLRR